MRISRFCRSKRKVIITLFHYHKKYVFSCFGGVNKFTSCSKCINYSFRKIQKLYLSIRSFIHSFILYERKTIQIYSNSSATVTGYFKLKQILLFGKQTKNSVDENLLLLMHNTWSFRGFIYFVSFALHISHLWELLNILEQIHFH